MTNLGKSAYFLGMKFTSSLEAMSLHHKKYASEVLRRFNMASCNPLVTLVELKAKIEKSIEKDVDVTLFKQIVGSLRYLCNSRLDICYGVGLISKLMDDPRKPHMVVAKRIMRYFQGTLEFGVLFPDKMQQEKSMLIGYLD